MGRDNVQNEEIEIDIGHILSILWLLLQQA